ncbi:hypothetical protein EX895_002840 [Sporisorium graminicola]|uniref:Tyrosine specific protein phosphatases domain-containing protein n=1 Tax=Sporisorium graminicola TaxID=280036 RepID=A0A4U7KUE1_9BASI|nr:hypothetical protein EX895_002840 [Sporisorium graminicola]TKY88130.1 hypothetical protein EX895_002840 [Sporisorium graminicola]
MAQPVVQQPTLSPPLSPSGVGLASLVRSPSSELSAKAAIFANGNSTANNALSNGVNKTLKESNGSQSHHRHKSRPRPSSSRSGSINGSQPHTNGAPSRQHQQQHFGGVEAAKDPSIAKAPGASFSIATKPQDRDPSLLRQPPQQKGFDGLGSYQLDHNGRIPASEYNYMQRDKLVASAQESAIRSGNFYWVALMDLAHLASQHHLSPYSALKFGPRGSPFAYIPITLQQPQVVEKTMLRQRQEEVLAKAWLITKRQKKLGLVPDGHVPLDSNNDLPVLTLPSEMFKPINGKQANGTAPPQSIGTKRPASLTTPPETRARSVFRTDPVDTDEAKKVERDLSEAMADSIDASRSPPMQVLAPASSAASSSEEDLSVTPANADQVDLSRFDRSTRMVEVGTSNEPKAAIASTHQQQLAAKDDGAQDGIADELMTSSQAGSSVEVGGPMDEERIMAQEMENATPSDKPAHPDASKDASLGSLAHANGNSCGSATNNGAESHSRSNHEQLQNQLAMKTSDTHPIHISPILPDDLLAEVGRRIYSIAEPQLLRLGSIVGNSSADKGDAAKQQQLTALSRRYFEEHAREQVQGERLIRLRNMLDLTSVTATDPSANYLSQSQLAEQASKENTLALSSVSDPGESRGPTIGNLLLSSCPGKKVRLSGPVRGRGAICRDLGLDLARIYSIGVRAVVCCLNDEELSYLGAPWDEYEREADRLGLDVYRLPMAEGFAPTNVQEMDAAMTSIVTDCTMKGTNVLVHCRGGVGRAGLIACSWLLKMGFVGEQSKRGLEMDVDLEAEKLDGHGSSREIVERSTSAHSHGAIVNSTGSDGKQQEQEESECETILDTVSCLIDTIRRRRSPKAIETAEQVRFLVEYVTFLHRQERLKASYDSSSS